MKSACMIGECFDVVRGQIGWRLRMSIAACALMRFQLVREQDLE